MDTCGQEPDIYDYDRVKGELDALEAEGTTLILPLATVIETGNHIAQIRVNRRPYAQAFVEILHATINSNAPWAAFSEQTELWNDENLRTLADGFTDLAEQGLGIGDATIKYVAEFYERARFDVQIFTGDGGLKAHQPASPNLPIPRRRQ